MGIDLGEKKVECSCVMESGSLKKTFSFHPQGYFKEPKKRHERWRNKNKQRSIHNTESAVRHHHSFNFEEHIAFSRNILFSDNAKRVKNYYNKQIYKFRTWQFKKATKKVTDIKGSLKTWIARMEYTGILRKIYPLLLGLVWESFGIIKRQYMINLPSI